LKDRGSKLFGLFFFLVLSGGIIYLLLTETKSQQKDNYESIQITGNILLNESQYLSYCSLNDSSNQNDLTLAEVKLKLEEHPYIVKSEVRFDGINKIIADVSEVNPKALILNENNFNIVTERCEMLPVLDKNLMISFPIISNLSKANGETLSDNDLESAFRIIDAVKLVDENMFNNLAEINLRNGGDILIMFTGLQFPILFGKNNETKKILSLQKIWDNLNKENDLMFDIEYIDLRYKNRIFVGKRKSDELTGKPKVL
jgi:cell division septal protein FtsQ